MDYQEKLSDLNTRFELIRKEFTLKDKEAKLKKLESETYAENFWEDSLRAKKIMQEISALKEDIESFKSISKDLSDLKTLKELITEDPKFEKELTSEIRKVESQLSELELKMFLSGPYDQNPAIVSIHAGQGGTEAMDWVAMLSRMYQKYFSSQKWSYETVDEIPGEEAGFKTVTMIVKKPYSYGLLKAEAGVHRLVRQSPFNAANLRQTSFALVEVMPEIEEDSPEVEIKPEEVEFGAFRSGGHGGQNVNKVSTAVRIRHIPTGIVVTCQTQRYQAQNRENAMKLLKSKLWLLKQEEASQTKQKIRGLHITPGWGNQIRSYVLHPYKMVKDLRTEYETSDASSVLDGDIGEFIKHEVTLHQRSLQ